MRIIILLFALLSLAVPIHGAEDEHITPGVQGAATGASMGAGEDGDFLELLESPGIPFSSKDLSVFIPTEPTALSVWMLGDSLEAFTKDFDQFEAIYPNITLERTSFSDEMIYFRELQKAFERKEAPDVFQVNEEWFYALLDDEKLAAANPEIFSVRDLKSNFYPLSLGFTSGENVFAAPLFGNFLIMISNRRLLEDDRIFVGQKPGDTWPELNTNFQKFQEFGIEKVLTPIGLGNPGFSPHTFDLFLLLLAQSGTQNLDDQGAGDALSFVISFAKPFWDSLGDSTDEELFLDQEAAIIFGDKDTVLRLNEGIKTLTETKKNYTLGDNMELHLLPQFSPENPKTFGHIWGFAVSADAQNIDFAWALSTSLITEKSAKAHFLKTGETPLLRGLSDDIFAKSAELAIAGGRWQRLDFQKLFEDNVTAHLEGEEGSPSVEEILEKMQNSE